MIKTKIPRSFTEEQYQEYFKYCYRYAASFSDDISTQNAAFIITETVWIDAANKMPHSSLKNIENLQRPKKYDLMIHAEAGAVYTAAKLGVSTEGGVMFCPWAACSLCARAIVAAGLSKLIVHREAMEKTSDYWKEETEKGLYILKESGVEYESWSGKIGEVSNLFAGVIWQP